MVSKKRFYPSKRKAVEVFNENDFIEPQTIDLRPPFRMQDSTPNNVFNSYVERFQDEWINGVASIGSNNSLTQYSEFLINRLSYVDCANLSTDAIIRKAIFTTTNEIFNKGGTFLIDGESDSDIVALIEEKFKELKIFEHLSELSTRALIYGVAFLYIDTTDDNVTEPLYFSYEHLSTRKILGLKVIEPYLVGVSEVNSAEPLRANYMKPDKWFVSGNGSIDKSRLINLTFFPVPDLIKPFFNYGGVGLCQLMKDYVKDAQAIRKSLCDLFLRFRTNIIKTSLARQNMEEAKIRAKAINAQSNNLGLLLLTENEEYVQNITPVSGLERIQSQAFESMVVSSGLPATKLLGISPSGFNSTGEFDLSNYYDVISGYQNNLIKPLIEKLAQGILYSEGIKQKVTFEFTPLEKLDEKQIAETTNLNTDAIIKLYQAGIISAEQAFNLARDRELVPRDLNFDSENVEPMEYDTTDILGDFNAEEE